MKDYSKYDYDNLDDLLDSVFRMATFGVGDVNAGDGTVELPAHAADVQELEELGFYESQIEEIEMGRQAGIDVRSYAKDSYDWRQMREIRLGLEDDLDIRVYKNPLFSASQMREIRLGLRDHLAVLEYASLVNSTDEMHMKRMEMLADAYARCNEGYEKDIKDELTGIKVHITDDYMSALIQMPIVGGRDFAEHEIRGALRRCGITEGLVEENFDLLKDRGNWANSITIARGEDPIAGADGYYEFFFDTHDADLPIVNEDGTINYSAYNGGAVVKRGDIIAQYHPAEKGIPGHTVTGVMIRAENGHELSELKYQNILYNRASGKYFAKMNGAAFYSNATKTIRVSAVYQIPGDANYYNQVLQYPGDVHIKGSVDNGATIQASGNVLIDGYVGKATIIAGQDIVVKGGVNGNAKKTSLQAGGKIQGHFFENAKLVAGDDLFSTYFSNCDIKTYGAVIAMGDNSRIMGCEIMAARDVQAAYILLGKSNHMHITVGDMSWLTKIHEEYLTRMETLENEICQLEAVKENLVMTLSVNEIEQNEQFIRVHDAIQQKTDECSVLPAHIEHMAGVIKMAEKSRIVALERLDEGVVISVGGVKTLIPSTIGRRVITKAEAKKILLQYVVEQKNGGNV